MTAEPEVVLMNPDEDEVRELLAWVGIPHEQVVPAISFEEAARRKRLGLPRIMKNDAVYFSEEPHDAQV